MKYIIRFAILMFCVLKMSAQEQFNFTIYQEGGERLIKIDIINIGNTEISVLNPFSTQNMFFCDKILSLKISNESELEDFYKVESIAHFEKNQILGIDKLNPNEQVSFIGKLAPLLNGVYYKGFDSFTGEYNLESQKKYKVKLTYNVESDGHPSLPKDIFLTKEKEVVIP